MEWPTFQPALPSIPFCNSISLYTCSLWQDSISDAKYALEQMESLALQEI